ncbi:MAG: response regulator [Spirochaetales bacterium]|nr:response regulator [Spirochaetales bacterium]
MLVAEDNPVNRFVAREMLQRCGCSVFCVENGAEALRLFTDQKWDLIFMDCQMPVMDGYRTTVLIRKHERSHSQVQTPVVAMTAHVQKADEQACYQAGMNGYLAKPVELNDLCRILEKYLAADTD